MDFDARADLKSLNITSLKQFKTSSKCIVSYKLLNNRTLTFQSRIFT